MLRCELQASPDRPEPTKMMKCDWVFLAFTEIRPSLPAQRGASFWALAACGSLVNPSGAPDSLKGISGLFLCCWRRIVHRSNQVIQQSWFHVRSTNFLHQSPDGSLPDLSYLRILKAGVRLPFPFFIPDYHYSRQS